jgi:hypothetical protein
MAYPRDGLPIRQRCLEQLRDAFGDIRRSNGYHHDMAVSLIYQAEQLATGGAMPAVVIVDEGRDERIDENICQITHSMPLSIYVAIRVVPGADWTRELSWLVSDIQKAVDDDNQLGGLALYTEVSGPLTYESPIDNIATSELKLDVVYRMKVGNPTSST